MVTLSDDNTMRIWRVDRGEEPLDANNVIGTAERSHREIGRYIIWEILFTVTSPISCDI